MTQSRGAVPVELTRVPAHGGKTLECWGAAKSILQDTWEERIRNVRRRVETYIRDEIPLTGQEYKSAEGYRG